MKRIGSIALVAFVIAIVLGFVLGAVGVPDAVAAGIAGGLGVLIAFTGVGRRVEGRPSQETQR